MKRYVLLALALALVGLYVLSGYSEQSHRPMFAYPVETYTVEFNSSLGGMKVATFLDDDNYLDVVVYSVDRPNGRVSWCYYTYAGDSNCVEVALQRRSGYQFSDVKVLPAGAYVYVDYVTARTRNSGSRVYKYNYVHHVVYDVHDGHVYYHADKYYDGYEGHGHSSSYGYNYYPNPIVVSEYSGTPGVYYVLFYDFVQYDHYYSSSSWCESEDKFFRLLDYFRGNVHVSSLTEWQTYGHRSTCYGESYWRKFPDVVFLLHGQYRIYYWYSDGGVGFYSNGHDYGIKVSGVSVDSLFCGNGDYALGKGSGHIYKFPWNSTTYEEMPSGTVCYPLYVGYASHSIGSDSGYYLVDENGVPVSPPFDLPVSSSVYANGLFHHYEFNGGVMTVTVYAAPPVVYGFEVNVLDVLSYDEGVESVPVNVRFSPVIDLNEPYVLRVFLDGNEVFTFDSNYPSEVNVPVSTPGDHVISVQVDDGNTVYSYGDVSVRVLARPWDVMVWYVVPEVNRAVVAATATDDTNDLHYDWDITAYFLDAPPVTREFNDTQSVDVNASDPGSPFYGAESIRACVSVTDSDGLTTSRCADIDLRTPTENVPEVVYGPPIERHIEEVKTRYLPVIRPIFETHGVEVSAPSGLSAIPIPYVVGGVILIVLFMYFFIL